MNYNARIIIKNCFIISCLILVRILSHSFISLASSSLRSSWYFIWLMGLINSILPSSYCDWYWLDNPQCLLISTSRLIHIHLYVLFYGDPPRISLAFTYMISRSYVIVCESAFFLTCVEVLELGLVTFSIFSPALCISIDHDMFNLYVRLTQDVSEARYVRAHVVRCFFCPVLYH
jgi:hypothetical protein